MGVVPEFNVICANKYDSQLLIILFTITQLLSGIRFSFVLRFQNVLV
jgi:hypothetical protein